MSANKNSPQLLLLYTLCAATIYLPRLTTHLNTPVTASLVSHLVISVVFWSTLTFIMIDVLLDISKVLGWISRPGFDFNLSDHLSAQWQLPGSEENGFWIKLVISAIIGVWSTFHIFFNTAKPQATDWEAAKRNTAARREAQKVAAAEQGGVLTAEDTGIEPPWMTVWLWIGCAYAYANAIFDSREWFLSMLKGGVKVERTIEWQWVCLCAPVLISALVGFVRWRWSVATKTRVINVRNIEVKELGHESGANIA